MFFSLSNQKALKRLKEMVHIRKLEKQDMSKYGLVNPNNIFQYIGKQEERVYVDVTFYQKEVAKKLGCKWDCEKQSWFIDLLFLEDFLISFKVAFMNGNYDKNVIYVAKNRELLLYNMLLDVIIYNQNKMKVDKTLLDKIEKLRQNNNIMKNKKCYIDVITTKKEETEKEEYMDFIEFQALAQFE